MFDKQCFFMWPNGESLCFTSESQMFDKQYLIVSPGLKWMCCTFFVILFRCVAVFRSVWVFVFFASGVHVLLIFVDLQIFWPFNTLFKLLYIALNCLNFQFRLFSYKNKIIQRYKFAKCASIYLICDKMSKICLSNKVLCILQI